MPRRSSSASCSSRLTLGRRPETDATVAQLMDRCTEVADWDLSTRKASEVYRISTGASTRYRVPAWLLATARRKGGSPSLSLMVC